MDKYEVNVAIPDIEVRRMLSTFADGKEHSFFEMMKLVAILTKKKDRYIWKKFHKRLLENGWVQRQYKAYSPYIDFYKLTLKGDELFRSIQIRIARLGKDNNAYRHFKYFNRDGKNKYGVNVEDNVSEEDANLREKHSEYYGS